MSKPEDAGSGSDALLEAMTFLRFAQILCDAGIGAEETVVLWVTSPFDLRDDPQVIEVLGEEARRIDQERKAKP